MPVFAYEGRGTAGEVKKGNIEASDIEAARARLRLMKIQPLLVRRILPPLTSPTNTPRGPTRTKSASAHRFLLWYANPSE